MAKSLVPPLVAAWSLLCLVPSLSAELSSIRLSAQTVSSAREVKIARTKTSSAFKKQAKTRKVVGVQVSTTKHEPQNVTLEALLVVEKEGEVHCQSFGKRHLKEVEAGRPEKLEFSTELEASTQRKSQGEITEKGERYKGWVIRAYDANRTIVAVVASLKHFEVYAYETPIR